MQTGPSRAADISTNRFTTRNVSFSKCTPVFLVGNLCSGPLLSPGPQGEITHPWLKLTHGRTRSPGLFSCTQKGPIPGCTLKAPTSPGPPPMSLSSPFSFLVVPLLQPDMPSPLFMSPSPWKHLGPFPTPVPGPVPSELFLHNTYLPMLRASSPPA